MSSDLAYKKCVPCEGGTPPFTNEQIQHYLKQLPADWDIIDGNPTAEQARFRASKIKKQFKFKSFSEALSFVNKVAGIAEEEGHHPNIHIYYNKVVIELWTHATHGLSENDFIMASKIEQLVIGD